MTTPPADAPLVVVSSLSRRFGTVQAVVEGLEPFRDRQWNSVWPRTSDFRFRLDAARKEA